MRTAGALGREPLLERIRRGTRRPTDVELEHADLELPSSRSGLILDRT
jgi:hypothetical protein